MECKRLPVDYEIKDFSLIIMLLVKNYGLLVYLKHQKTCQKGQATNCKKANYFNQYESLFNQRTNLS